MPDYKGFNTKNLSFWSEFQTQKQSSIYSSFGLHTISSLNNVDYNGWSSENFSQSRRVYYSVYCWSTTVQSSTEYLWTFEIRSTNFVARIGGMHWVMSFVECIGALMKNSGLLSWLKSAFAEGEKILTGTFPHECQGSLPFNAWATSRLCRRNEISKDESTKTLSNSQSECLLIMWMIKKLYMWLIRLCLRTTFVFNWFFFSIFQNFSVLFE